MRRLETGFLARAVLLGLSFVFYSGHLGAESLPVPADYRAAKKRYADAHAAFAASDFDRASDLYGSVETYLVLHPGEARYFDHTARGFLPSQLVAARAALPMPACATVHRILVLAVGALEAEWEGVPVRAWRSEGATNRLAISLGVLARSLEAMSAGAVTIRFDVVAWDGSIRELERNRGYGDIDNALPVLRSIEPYPSDLLFRGLEAYDTVLFFWNPGALATVICLNKVDSELSLPII
ncbi:MAG: hypothetical protein J0L75_15225 [Spirochaetes bacterium]|nr:hypothetical protein [Spirochaetota bacterium]